MRHSWLTRYCLVLALCCCAMPALAQDPQASDEQPATPDPVAAAIAKVNEEDNGLQVNREGLYVDVKAKVCLRAGEFLEMFACTKDTREHESILVLDTMPSTIHLGLLLLGQQPGKPLSYDLTVDPPKLKAATGPEVRVFVVREVDGQERETPANEWVRDNQTEKMMQDNTWLFAGSDFVEYEGKQLYLADVNGSAISLVNFGDDLLTLKNTLTDQNNSHDKVWAPRTDAIPKVGTEVVLRLRVQGPEPEKPAEQGEQQDAPAPAENPGQDAPASL